MIVIGVIGLIIGITIWYNSYTAKVNSAKLKKIEAQAEEALKKELLNPLSYVEIKTKSGLKFKTHPFEPCYKIEEDFDIFNFRVERVYCYTIKSSKDQAKKVIKKWIESDRFEDDSTDTYIPMCEIESFQILTSESK
jgi:hypothetical protein